VKVAILADDQLKTDDSHFMAVNIEAATSACLYASALTASSGCPRASALI
jgi:hypothetical protein